MLGSCSFNGSWDWRGTRRKAVGFTLSALRPAAVLCADSVNPTALLGSLLNPRFWGGVAAFVLCLLVFGSAGSLAQCECIWEGSFSEVEASTNLVVSGTVVGGKGNSVDLQISRLLRGKEPLETIRIWLQTGDYCRPEASLFPANSQWVMALHRIDELVPGGFNPNTPSISFGRVGDYSLSSCGGFWLNQSENLVTGNLINAPRWVREPKMTPVLLDLLADYVNGKVSADALLQATREDPALRELMLDTRAFLRKED